MGWKLTTFEFRSIQSRKQVTKRKILIVGACVCNACLGFKDEGSFFCGYILLLISGFSWGSWLPCVHVLLGFHIHISYLWIMHPPTSAFLFPFFFLPFFIRFWLAHFLFVLSLISFFLFFLFFFLSFCFSFHFFPFFFLSYFFFKK